MAAAVFRSAARGLVQRSSFRRALSSSTTRQKPLSPQDKKVVKRISLKLDKLDRILDRREKALGEAIRCKLKRDSRNKLLLRASVLGGAAGAVYMMQRFFAGSRQEDCETT